MKINKLFMFLLIGAAATLTTSCKKELLTQEKPMDNSLKTASVSTEIIAHRGSNEFAPENTLASARLAWEENADILECDVWLSADKRVMVSHDETTKRITGVDYSIPKTQSSVLRTLDVGKYKSDKYAGEKMPFLEELIATVPPGKRLFIELKSGDDMDAEELVPYVRDIIQKSGKESQMTIISFELDALKLSKQLIPNTPAVLVSYNYFLNIPYLFSVVSKYNLDGLDTYYLTTTRLFINEAKKRNIPIYVWTVDKESDAKKLADKGVKGITTNRPGYIRDILSN
ncbi:MAG: glycerophosphodiester phosphodiesterase family protein [Hyphomicrobiales bacterium]